MTRQKKSVIYIFCILCVLAVTSAAVIPLLEKSSSNESSFGTYGGYYEPDYDYNIYNDSEYTELNRDLSYTDGAVTFTYSLDDDLSSVDSVLGFFASYLKCIINGDFAVYPTFFDEEYKNKVVLPKKFTMQMLYNISLEKLTQADGSTVYKLDYLIRKNNGTFRPEIGSDGCKSQYITLEKIGDSCLISNIYTINIKTEVVS